MDEDKVIKAALGDLSDSSSALCNEERCDRCFFYEAAKTMGPKCSIVYLDRAYYNKKIGKSKIVDLIYTALPIIRPYIQKSKHYGYKVGFQKLEEFTKEYLGELN